jgi:hypothetical protein
MIKQADRKSACFFMDPFAKFGAYMRFAAALSIRHERK